MGFDDNDQSSWVPHRSMGGSRRARVDESRAEIDKLLTWYNRGSITLSVLRHNLRLCGMDPPLSELERPVNQLQLLANFDRRLHARATKAPSSARSTDFIANMMAPANSPATSPRRDTKCSSPIVHSSHDVPTAPPNRPCYAYDHGNILSWSGTSAHRTDNQPFSQRTVANRSSLDNSMQPRVAPKLSMQRRHIDVEHQRHALIEEQRQRLTTKLAYEANDAEVKDVPDNSIWSIKPQPGYHLEQPPFGVDNDGAKALAKISTSYILLPPYDCSNEVTPLTAPVYPR